MYCRSAPRRRHGAEFKAKVLADCAEPGASISGVALAHGLNANLVRQWRAGRGAKLVGMTVTPPAVKRSKDKTPTKPCPTGKWAFCINFAGIAILVKLQCSMELH
jgi:hypothetical protein